MHLLLRYESFRAVAGAERPSTPSKEDLRMNRRMRVASGARAPGLPFNGSDPSEKIKSVYDEPKNADQEFLEGDILSHEALARLATAKVMSCSCCHKDRLVSEVTLGYSGWICVHCIRKVRHVLV
jgi:hypothetical protein